MAEARSAGQTAAIAVLIAQWTYLAVLDTGYLLSTRRLYESPMPSNCHVYVLWRPQIP